MKPPPPPILFRIVGKSRDGRVVTLGRYATEEAAKPDLARFVKDAFYTDLKLNHIPQPPAAPAAPAATAVPPSR